MEVIEVKVNYVFDGDTILVVRENGSSFKSRARWIDAPEIRKPRQRSNNPELVKHWEWGVLSRHFLTNLIGGKKIIVAQNELDAFGRRIGDWYFDSPDVGNSIAVILAKNGLVANSLPFQQYDFPNNDLDLYIGILSACAEAKKHKLGFWAETNFLLPYKLKKSQRS
ncbi:thermonuclease family protein [Microseira sp. BLCC-F43]|jgi:endonuclease YncB( thermonuclease family)|uniref:thermonuclease family protein n=1 Tax=Microseira sp. BLCC-F43 TaxID=3153602 RepID=UPI0035B77AA6